MYFGIGVAGINRPVFWGFYLTNFVFWIGISHAGTLISAILRLVNATWRRPVTRCAEVITVFALMIGAMFPIIHLGKPWLAFWLAPYPSGREIWPNFRSPLVWDFFAINTYLTGSLLFLLLPMIPDFALVRDRTTGWRKQVYGTLALGWQGTTKQWHRLEAGMQIMAIAIIPVAVSVHTIVSFDFSMATVPMWHSTIFGPYFVAGAIFSGIAALIIAMAALRRLLHLEGYLHPVHFENLGKLLLLMSLLWAYFVFAERLTVWYGNEHSEMAVFWATQRDAYAPLYWTMVVCNFVIPLPILGLRRLRTVTGTVVASCGVIVGMWLERYLIIVPSLGHKPLPYSWGRYSPQPTEIFIMGATFAAMALLYMIFTKFVPIISIWELKVGNQPHPTRALSTTRTISPGCGRRVHEGRLRALHRSRGRPAGSGRAAVGWRRRSRHRRDVLRAVRGVRVQPPRQGDVAPLDRRRRGRGRPRGRLFPDHHHAAALAPAHERDADRGDLAEHDRRVRDDDARRDRRDRGGAVHHGEAAQPSAAALRPGGERRLHPGGRERSGRDAGASTRRGARRGARRAGQDDCLKRSRLGFTAELKLCPTCNCVA